MDHDPYDPRTEEVGSGPLPLLPNPPPCDTNSLPSPENKKRPSSPPAFPSGGHNHDDHPLPLTTFTHYLTSLNRIHADDLERGGRYNTHEWTPLFVTEALQLPATLAYVLQYSSGLALSSYMVRGKLVDHAGSCVEQGMVVLGRGKRNRQLLDEWFGESMVRVHVQVEITLADSTERRMTALRWLADMTSEHYELQSGNIAAESGYRSKTDDDAEEGADETETIACNSGVAHPDDLGDGPGGCREWIWREANTGVEW